MRQVRRSCLQNQPGAVFVCRRRGPVVLQPDRLVSPQPPPGRGHGFRTGASAGLVSVVYEVGCVGAYSRVRKAIKFGVVLLDVGWVFGKDEGDPKIMKVRPVEEWSWDEGGVIDPDDHKRVSKVTVGSTSLSSYREKKDDDILNSEEGKDDQLKKWGKPQSLGCCCVCHENGTEATCPWCQNCPRNIERTDSETTPLCLPAT